MRPIALALVVVVAPVLAATARPSLPATYPTVTWLSMQASGDASYEDKELLEIVKS